jgi:hypothetical protein
VWTADTSFGALLFWASAALTSAERVLSDENFSPWPHSSESPDSLTKTGDAAMMLLTLRTVLRAAEWAGRGLQHHGSEVTAWMAEFNRTVPDLVNARNALEHFDEYATGRGRLQRPAPEKYLFSFSAEGGEPVVRVGRFSIGVRLARDACRKLVIHLLAAPQSEQPARAEVVALLDEILADLDDQ